MSTLFSPPFPPASHSDWLSQVQKDLKDNNIYESLRWISPEGFTVEPYYTAEQTAALDFSELQIPQKSSPGWLNAPAYFAVGGQEKDLNLSLRDALANGAEALVIDVPHGQLSVARLLDGIKLSNTPVYFRLATDVDAATFLGELRQIAPYQLRGGLLAGSGTLPAHVLINAIDLCGDSPGFRPIAINSHDFHSAGGTATQELAFTLARLAETHDSLITTGLSTDLLMAKTMISVSVGTSYFMEMAKLRALRVLTAKLFPDAPPVFLHVQTSSFYEAAATSYTNLLRTTTEAMAAVIGGADALTVRPYDAVLGTSTDFSERIARNVSSLLKSESYFDKVADPAAGSYYIETLTHHLTEAAWTLYRHMLELGGLTKATQAGYIQQALSKAYEAKVEAVRDGRVLVGVTKFRHDEAGDDSSRPTQPDNTDKLPMRRLASEFE